MSLIKTLSIFLLVCLSSSSYGQERKHGSIIIRKEKYYLAKGCRDILKWEEVITNNKSVTDKINNVLRKKVKQFKFNKEDRMLVCDTENNFGRIIDFKVVYLNNNVLSYHLLTQTYYKGVVHDFFEFAALNFSTTTGRQLHFKDIFDSAKFDKLESVLNKRMNDEVSANECLVNEAYNVKDDGIEFLFWRGTFPNTVTISYKELLPFLNPKGPLMKIYSKKKT
jgi:hypothetical protein